MASVRGSAVSVLPAFLVEQLLALIEGEEDRGRRRVLPGQVASRDVAQRREELGEPVVSLPDEVLNVGAASRQAALADPVGEARLAHHLLQRLGEPVLARDRCALGPEDRERQPCLVVAPEARP